MKKAVLGQNGSGKNWYGQNGMDKMVYGQNGIRQNGMDKMVQTKWYEKMLRINHQSIPLPLTI